MHVDIQVLNQGFCRIVGKVDVLKADVPATLRKRTLDRLNHLFPVEQVVDAPRGSQRMLHGGKPAGNALQRPRKELCVKYERDHFANVDRAVNRQRAAEQADCDIRQIVGQRHDGLDDAGKVVAGLEMSLGCVNQRFVRALLAVFQMERLNRCKPRKILFVERVNLADKFPPVGKVLLAPLRNQGSDRQRKRNEHDNAQRHQRLNGKHDHRNTDELDDT